MGSNSRLFSRLFIIVLVIKFIDVFKGLLIAAFLGVSDNADIYNSLISIPDSLIVLFGLDTIRGVVNSEYAHLYGVERMKELWRSFNNLFNLLFWAGLIVTVLAVVFSPVIIGILLPGFTGAKKELSVTVSRIIFPILFFRILWGYYHSVMNSVKKFYLPVIAPVVVSLALIVSVILPVIGGDVVFNLSYANLAGNIVVFLILTYSLKELGASFKVGRIETDELTVKVLKASGSILLLVIANQIYLFSKNYFASYFGEGAVSALHYSGTVPAVVMSVVFATFFTALISKLSTLFSEGRNEDAQKLYRKTLAVLMFATVPAVVIFTVYGKEILTVLYLRGKFDTAGLEMTMLPYYWDVLSLITFLTYIIPTAYLLAKKEYKLLTIAGSIIYAIGTVLNYFLTSWLGFYAISIGHLITTGAYGIILLLLSWRNYNVDDKATLKIMLMIIGGIPALAVVCFMKTTVFTGYLNLGTPALVMIIAINTTVTILIYLLAMSIFRANYAKEFLSGILRK